MKNNQSSLTVTLPENTQLPLKISEHEDHVREFNNFLTAYASETFGDNVLPSGTYRVVKTQKLFRKPVFELFYKI